ncbi:hypothetical protein [Pseudobythopirellula maris]|uniref:hypothetical protein n=1 Tax=Pseudobythopirellula maris TaxID=2527991 RepID=UPI0011B540C9|nr:hypothetical protein [Pseudobythopirellula maris]
MNHIALLANLIVGAGATASDSWWGATLWSTAAIAAFFVGMGIGDRSRLQFCRTLQRANRLLGDQNADLCEENLRLLKRIEGFKRAGSDIDPE